MRCEVPVLQETTSNQLVKQVKYFYIPATRLKIFQILKIFQEVEDCLGLKPDFYEDFNPMSVFDPMFSSLPPDTISSNVPPSSRSSSSSSSSSCSSLDTIELTEYQELRSGDGLASYLYDYSESLNSEELESELAQPQLSRMINSARAQKIILQERS